MKEAKRNLLCRTVVLGCGVAGKATPTGKMRKLQVEVKGEKLEILGKC